MHAAPQSLLENEVAVRYQDLRPITHLNAPFASTILTLGLRAAAHGR